MDPPSFFVKIESLRRDASTRTSHKTHFSRFHLLLCVFVSVFFAVVMCHLQILLCCHETVASVHVVNLNNFNAA